MADLFEVVITAIIRQENKYLLLQRSADKRRFPGKWTVAGGHLEVADFAKSPKDTHDYWYNVLEKTLRREVMEEAGIAIRNIVYVTSLATVHADGAPSLVISCGADYASGDVSLQPGETDAFAWVSLDEAKSYDLIDGIYDELKLADALYQGRRSEWIREAGS